MSKSWQAVFDVLVLTREGDGELWKLLSKICVSCGCSHDDLNYHWQRALVAALAAGDELLRVRD